MEAPGVEPGPLDFQSNAMTASAKPPYTIMGNETLKSHCPFAYGIQYLLTTGIDFVIVGRNKFTILVYNISPLGIVTPMVVT